MGYAQSSSKGKIMVEIDYGYAAFCGNSNLSPYGAHYRNAYNGGMLLNAELVYTFTGGGVGLRWTGITSSANYNLTRVRYNLEFNKQQCYWLKFNIDGWLFGQECICC